MNYSGNNRVEMSRCHRCGITSHPGQVWKKCLICKGPVETIVAEVYEVDSRNFTDFIDQIMPPPERFMDAMRQYAKELEDEIISGRGTTPSYPSTPDEWWEQMQEQRRFGRAKPMDKATFTKLWNGEWPE